MPLRANYARCSFQQQLGPSADSLDLPWAEYAGDSTDPVTFDVPTDNPVEPYVEMQVYDVDSYGHDVLVNDEALSGFDIPKGEGWQFWMDTVVPDRLQSGENKIRFRRDTDSRDAFAVGSVVVHWKEPRE